MEGVLLRDHFAMSALNGLLAGDITGESGDILGCVGTTSTPEGLVARTSRAATTYSRIAYELADAMLAARKIPCRLCGKPLADSEAWMKSHRECSDKAEADRPELRLVDLGGEG